MMRRLLLCALIASLILSGCSGLFESSKSEEQGFSMSDTLLRVDGEPCRLYEAAVLLTAQKEMYEGAYSDEIWKVTTDGKDFGGHLKDRFRIYAAQYFTGYMIASSMGIRLSSEEEQAAAEAARRYTEGLGELSSALGISYEDAVTVYRRYRLAVDGYSVISGRGETEISEDEARVVRLQQIRFVTTGLSESAAGEKLNSAYEAYDLIVNQGKDFGTTASKYNEVGQRELTVTRDDLSESEEKVVFNMGTGDISPVTAVEGGYAIYRCISSNVTEETAVRRSELAARAREEAYRAALEAYVAKNPLSWNDEIWDQLDVDEMPAGGQFYEIYRNCFGE